MGIVLAAYHRPLKRKVALKVLKAEPLTNPNLVTRFKEEAQIASQLQHPGIAPVHEMGMLPDGRPFFAMKLIVGKTFAELMDESLANKSLEKDRARFLLIFEQICQTVAFAHSRGVLHRDLKPANVMVGAFGEVQVMDWGLGKVLSAGGREDLSRSSLSVETLRTGDSDLRTQHGQVFGTYAFMPPEQANGHADLIGPPSDVFALGAILCCVLAGQPPYAADKGSELIDAAKRGDIGPALGRLKADATDPGLVSLATRCLDPDPSKRPSNASEVAREVRAYLDGVQQKLLDAELGKARAEAGTRAEHRRRKAQLLSLTAMGLLLTTIISGIVWYSFNRKHRDMERLAEEERASTAKYYEILNRHQIRASNRKPGWILKSLAELEVASRLAVTGKDATPIRSSLFDCLWNFDVVESHKIELREVAGGLATHPDGEVLVVGYYSLVNGKVALDVINLVTGKVIREIRFSPDKFIADHRVQDASQLGIQHLAFTADGNWLVAGSTGAGIVYCWKWAKTDDLPRAINTQMGKFYSITPDTRHGDSASVYVCRETELTGPSKGLAGCYRIADGKLTGEFRAKEVIRTIHPANKSESIYADTIDQVYQGTLRQFNTLGFAPAMVARHLAGISDDDRYAIYRNDGKTYFGSFNPCVNLVELLTFAGLSFSADSAIFTRDAHHALVMCDDRLQIRSTTNLINTLEYVFPKNTRKLSGNPLIAQAGNSGFALVVGGDQLHVCQITKPAIVSFVAGEREYLSAMAVSHDGESIVTMGSRTIPPHGGKTWLNHWNISGARPDKLNETSIGNLFNSKQGSCSLEMSPDGRWIAAVGNVTNQVDGKVVLWNPSSNQIDQSIEARSPFWGCSFGPLNNLVTFPGPKIDVWSRDGMRPKQIFSQFAGLSHSRNRFDMGREYSIDDNQLSSGSIHGDLTTCEIGADGITNLAEARVTSSAIACLSHRGLGSDKKLFAGDSSGNLFVLDARSLKLLRHQADSHAGVITSINHIRDDVVVTTGRDSMIKFWRESGDKYSLLFEGSAGSPVKQAFITANGRLMHVLCDGDRGVRRVDLAQMETVFDSLGVATNSFR
ncbi:protein kinase domain-containing protein [Zavarzinella formosa]|uniref:protein kinase domain-containing protein n=1 Tax=Zavarzinella formosa TaxID=360055 RepID=UPI001EE65ADD|nr:protein kinase [Zavarzinella formosa]